MEAWVFQVWVPENDEPIFSLPLSFPQLNDLHGVLQRKLAAYYARDVDESGYVYETDEAPEEDSPATTPPIKIQ